MADIINSPKTETAEVSTKQTQEAPQAVQPAKTFTQDEVNGIVKSRIERERDGLAKALGLGEQYSKESFEKFVETYKSTRTQAEELAKKNQEYETQLSQKEKSILGFRANVTEEKIDEALTLAELKVKKTEGLSIEEALKEVVNEFPNLTRKDVAKIGIEAGNKTEVNPNPYLTKGLQKKYPWLGKK
jgi:hypothetical protein